MDFYLLEQGNMKIIAVSNKHGILNQSIKDCACIMCKKYTRAYLHHLFKANEMTGYMLATIHNLHFMIHLMTNYRNKILQDEI